ncbi:unnamed protein product [Linum tenue]|uniref:ubiquitinyl hydrolase 1 n=1 Tax=Linum tenue TaxID=586396 RepID=A0AAV0GPE2_9ROSI|nr:unnamed protein product [Linum tenue]
MERSPPSFFLSSASLNLSSPIPSQSAAALNRSASKLQLQLFLPPLEFPSAHLLQSFSFTVLVEQYRWSFSVATAILPAFARLWSMTESYSNASASSTSSYNSSVPDTEDDQVIASLLAEEENANAGRQLGKRLSHLDSIPHTPRVNGQIPDVNDATLDHVRLSGRLNTYGLAELQMEGDGNCQFRALADQLFRSPDYHKHVRKQVVKQLKHFRKMYESHVPMRYRSYVNKMKKSGEWGDHVTLQAAADRFEAKICLVTSFRDTCYIEIRPKDKPPGREIWLSFWSEVHYNSLCPQQSTKEKALALLICFSFLKLYYPVIHASFHRKERRGLKRDCSVGLRLKLTMRSTIMIKLGLLLCFVSANFVIPSQSAVSSVDLGSEWMKVAVVNLKPGQSPIAVAINEMSKRKSPALVSFNSGTRLLAEEAAGITARYPNKVFSQLRDMIGKSYNDVKGVLDSMYLPFDAVEDSRGAVAFKVDEGQVYSVEELLAMILGYASNLAEVHAKLPVKDAVISVPPYFGQAERRGLIQAAQLAGMNVLTLINEHSGAALQYGIDKDFSNGSRYVIFYDMGSSSTYAALVYYSAYNAKEFGKTVSINQFQVKDVRWNSELGGQNMEMRLVEFFADEFNKQVGNGVDVRKSPKAMAKLKKQVKRTKEILSANIAAPISVESLYDDRDFRSSITREKFEELCGDLWDKSLVPIKEVIKHSGLKVDEISAVELIGGATRVPKLQAKIQELLGRNELDKHLDADEAIVLGAALHAANLSDGIKLNRKLGMIDGSSYGLAVVLDGPDFKDRQSLVPRMKKVPSKTFRSIVLNKDFEVSLEYESNELLPPSISSPVFAQYSVSGLTEASEKYSSRNLSSPIKANLHFSLSRSGVLSLDRADALVEISEWVEVPIKKNLTAETITNSSSSTPETGTDKGAAENTTTSSATENSSEGSNETAGSESNSDVKEPITTKVATEKKLKKRTFRVPLKITEKTAGPGKPLSEESLAEAKRKLEELNKKDAERRRTAESKNNLEGYIYSTKEKLETDEEFEKISTSEERQSFVEKLDEVQDWLYTDGEDATASEFEKRMDSLKTTGDPIFFRYKELSDRPGATKLARKYLTELKQIVEGWEANKPWLPKDRITEVLNDGEKLKSWLDEKEAEQKQTSASSKPAFTSEEVYTKVFKLQDKVTSINKIPKPKPKVEKTKKNETEEPKKAETEEDPKKTEATEEPKTAAEEATSEKDTADTQAHDEL